MRRRKSLKIRTDKQRKAGNRNFDIFRLRGVLANLSIIIGNNTMPDGSAELMLACTHVRMAMLKEDFKVYKHE